MNEWMLVGLVILGTVILLGGGGWLAKALSRSDKKGE
jgi:hypothetical protein|tara:strand:+ start:1059 stop:1169 length:111 start_codon:yes stop_codon:yes gene_type:complete